MAAIPLSRSALTYTEAVATTAPPPSGLPPGTRARGRGWRRGGGSGGKVTGTRSKPEEGASGHGHHGDHRAHREGVGDDGDVPGVDLPGRQGGRGRPPAGDLGRGARRRQTREGASLRRQPPVRGRRGRRD